MENNSTEESASMRNSANSDGERSPSNTDINDPENLDYEEDHLPGQTTLPAPVAGSDEGELDEADLEDGEIHDPTASKTKTADEDQNGTSTEKTHCRYFLQGRCHWGPNCKYIHPTSETNKVVENSSTSKSDSSPPNSAGLPMPQIPMSNWISPQPNAMNSHFFPNPMIRGPAPIPVMSIGSATGAESAWERGLRSAKTLREQSMRRKQQDKDFNEKKFNLSLRDALDEKETNDHQPTGDQRASVDHGLDDLPPGAYGDRYHPCSYSNSRYSNRRSDPREDFVDHRHYRKDSTSSKTKSRKNENPSYRRNSSQAQYPAGSHDDSTRSTSYHNRRADDWHDPWERSKNHGNRRSSRTGRERSFTSSSRSSSSSSRSTRSRSRSNSSSSRSRSRSRSRVKRRSHSTTHAAAAGKTSNETVKNGNEKKSNGNKKLPSPSPPSTTKFLPGRQISSHTLKKAAKSSNSNHSSNHQHSNDKRGKDTEKKSKTNSKKNAERSDSSSSSSSSSDSDDQRAKRRSPSSSSSSSSSSENESRKGKETKTKKISGGTSKKRRDTSSSTGSASVAKKSKLIADSHPPSTEATPAESSDSNKKRR